MRETWQARFKPVAPAAAAAVAVAGAASASVQPAAARKGGFSIMSVVARPQKAARLSSAPVLDELDEYLEAEVPDAVYEDPDEWYKTGLLAGPWRLAHFIFFCETSKLESSILPFFHVLSCDNLCGLRDTTAQLNQHNN